MLACGKQIKALPEKACNRAKSGHTLPVPHINSKVKEPVPKEGETPPLPHYVSGKDIDWPCGHCGTYLCTYPIWVSLFVSIVNLSKLMVASSVWAGSIAHTLRSLMCSRPSGTLRLQSVMVSPIKQGITQLTSPSYAEIFRQSNSFFATLQNQVYYHSKTET